MLHTCSYFESSVVYLFQQSCFPLYRKLFPVVSDFLEWLSTELSYLLFCITSWLDLFLFLLQAMAVEAWMLETCTGYYLGLEGHSPHLSGWSWNAKPWSTSTSMPMCPYRLIFSRQLGKHSILLVSQALQAWGPVLVSFLSSFSCY